jgi:farnesyl-diphosphate farnesyltransferase
MNHPDPSADVLRYTARTFAISIRLLPAGMREPVRVAYLLARIADTVADRAPIAPARRDALLDLLIGAVRTGTPPPDLSEAAPRERSRIARAETSLLLSAPEQIAALGLLPADDRQDVVRTVQRLATTMRTELELFAGASRDRVVALEDAATLLSYTEGIAGCVGEFWTGLVARHACALGEAERKMLAIEGRRYGRGLQLVNVLRDIGVDVERGRCFLPARELAGAGIDPRRLLDPSERSVVVRVIAPWAERARSCLLAGLEYASRMPTAPRRVRLATSLPAALGLETLARLENDECWLTPGRKVSISKGRLRLLLAVAAATSLGSRTPRALTRIGRGRFGGGSGSSRNRGAARA